MKIAFPAEDKLCSMIRDLEAAVGVIELVE